MYVNQRDNMVETESIKVVIRTRPTPDFASKNLNIDPNTQVSSLLSALLFTKYKSLV